jgi:choline dehydrogenase-like flavoprotein
MSQNFMFDYIIVGAGSAGCVLARRLLDNSDATVCLIEAGKKDQNPLIHIPFGVALLSRFTSINWNYNSQPQEHLNNRSLFWPRGKVMGGSSSVNAMCYIRGDSEDYNDWATEFTLQPNQQASVVSWSYEDVLPLFKHSEQNTQLGDTFRSAYHGADGPLGVTTLNHTDPLSQSFLGAAQTAGLPHNHDFNGPSRYGVGEYQATHIDGQRCSAAKGYIESVLQHPRLTVLTETTVLRVLCDEQSASGVLVHSSQGEYELIAKQEVILSGGAINSPQLLMLSGIGAKAELAEHDIPCILDLPGVGKNLQDHLDVIVQMKTKQAVGYALLPRVMPKFIKGAWDYLTRKRGLLSSNVAETGGFTFSRHGTAARPDLQFHFIPAILLEHGRKTAFDYGFGLHVCHLYPKSRGTIRLASTDPFAAPLIDPNYLAEKEDLEALIDGVRWAMKIFSQPEFVKYSAMPLEPDNHHIDDATIEAFIRAKAETVYHPVGTCKMGPKTDPLAVVDSDLCVHGIAGLRVVDASVMPTVVGGNTNAPTIMIAEQAARIITKE